MRLLVVSVFPLNIRRFKRIKRNLFETFLLTLNFETVTEAITQLALTTVYLLWVPRIWAPKLIKVMKKR